MGGGERSDPMPGLAERCGPRPPDAEQPPGHTGLTARQILDRYLGRGP